MYSSMTNMQNFDAATKILVPESHGQVRDLSVETTSASSEGCRRRVVAFCASSAAGNSKTRDLVGPDTARFPALPWRLERPSTSDVMILRRNDRYDVCKYELHSVLQFVGARAGVALVVRSTYIRASGRSPVFHRANPLRVLHLLHFHSSLRPLSLTYRTHAICNPTTLKPLTRFGST